MSVDFRRTFHSPLNNSSSKHQFSFSKSQRFQPSTKSYCRSSFYETKKGAIDPRSTSFGFGSKTNFVNTEGVPEAGAYKKLSQFSTNKNHKKGYSFGNDNNRSLINNPEQARRSPGPGSYISINQKHKTGYGQGFHNLSYSFRGKYQDPLTKGFNVIGPSHYEVNDGINKKGNYFDAKYKSSMSPKMGKQSRFIGFQSITPGPNKYYGDQKTSINGTGSYFNTKYLSEKANFFGHSVRPSAAKKAQGPDPGVYSYFSDFALKNQGYSRK